MTGRVAYVVRSWPRLSQTFVLNEVLALERLRLRLRSSPWSAPARSSSSRSCAQVRAAVHYLDDARRPRLPPCATRRASLASAPGRATAARPAAASARGLRHRLDPRPVCRSPRGWPRHPPVGRRRAPDRPHARPLRPRPGAGGDVRPPAHRRALQLHRPRPRPLRDPAPARCVARARRRHGDRHLLPGERRLPARPAAGSAAEPGPAHPPRCRPDRPSPRRPRAGDAVRAARSSRSGGWSRRRGSPTCWPRRFVLRDRRRAVPAVCLRRRAAAGGPEAPATSWDSTRWSSWPANGDRTRWRRALTSGPTCSP